MNQQTPFNFYDTTEFTRMMSEFRMPGFDMEGFVAIQRKNMEAMTAANQLVMEGLQAVMRRQGEIVRSMMEESSTLMREAMVKGGPEEKMSRQADLARETFERMITNMKEMVETLSKSQTEAGDVLSRRISDSITELKQAMQQATPRA